MEKIELKELLPEIINNENLPLEVSANAALALGLSFLKSEDEDIINVLLTSLLSFG